MIATHFIEVFKDQYGDVRQMSVADIKLIDLALRTSKKFNCETIAIFKIYPRLKPMIAHYDYDIKTMIVE